MNSKANRFRIWLVFIVSILGFADAAYLTAKHYAGEVPPCTILKGCEVVTTSQYSEISGVPVALLGTVFYLTVFLLMVAYFDSRKEIFIKLVSWVSLPAFLATLWFLYLQFFVIKAVCLYCLFSAISSTMIFLAVLPYYISLRKKKVEVAGV